MLPSSLAHLAHEKSLFLAGDWHGNTAWALAKLGEAQAKNHRAIFHLGDFGIWTTPKGERFLDVVNTKAARLNIPIILTPGNHEDWDWLFQGWERNNFQPLAVRSHIWALPRNYRFVVNNRTILSFGGAASVDFDNRVLGKNWWMKELPSVDEVEKACSGNVVDVLLAHETPDLPYAVPQTEDILLHNPMNFRAEGLAYSDISRQRLTQVLEALKPKVFLHGHIHVYDVKQVQLPKADYSTHIISLHKENNQGNVFELDLENLDKISLPR